jgi:hypothetical protein
MLEIGYFKLAKNVSKYSDYKIKVGAVIARRKPIGVASNKCKTHPIHANPDKSLRKNIHAEIRAVINCGNEDLKGAIVYVYRQTKDGKPALARPCNYCYNYLKERGVRTIYYTTNEEPYWRMEDL